MFRLDDRHGKRNVLGPTAEEVVTYLAVGEIKSYKQLPINLYQISAKFRDEFRPRFGPIRSREFIMKDAYSFDADHAGLDKSYKAMYDAYCRIFKRCGLEYVVAEAEVGEMGGSGSHQFTVPCASGEDTIIYTEDGSYAANLERAAVDPLPKDEGRGRMDDGRKIPPMQEVHTPNIGSIEAVCAYLKTHPMDMIKTLIYNSQDGAIAALVRGDHDLNPEKLTQALEGKHVELADEPTIEKVTGAKVRFAGPMGIAEKVSKMIIDHAVAAMAVGVDGLVVLHHDSAEGVSIDSRSLWTAQLSATPVRWGAALTEKECVVTLSDGLVVCLVNDSEKKITITCCYVPDHGHWRLPSAVIV